MQLSHIILALYFLLHSCTWVTSFLHSIFFCTHPPELHHSCTQFSFALMHLGYIILALNVFCTHAPELHHSCTQFSFALMHLGYIILALNVLLHSCTWVTSFLHSIICCTHAPELHHSCTQFPFALMHLSYTTLSLRFSFSLIVFYELHHSTNH